MSLRVSRQVLEAFGRATGLAVAPSLPSDPSLLLAVNWRGGLEVETSWNTILSKNPATLAEERVSVLDRPYRRVSIPFFSRSHEEAAYLSRTLQVFCSGQFPIPIFPDVALVTYSSSGDRILGDFSLRRFFVGQLVAVLTSSGTEFREILQVRDDSLLLDSTVTVAKEDLVYPLLWCDPLTEVPIQCLTDHLIEVSVDCLESNKNTALPATWTGYIEGPFQYFLGLPILETEPNWVSGIDVKLFRESEQYGNYVSREIFLHGTKPLFSSALDFLFDSREEFWKHLNFFDSRQGRTKPFYVPSPLSPWRASVQSATQIDLVADFPQSTLDNLASICVRNLDYSVLSAHSVSSITPGSGKYTLTISPGIAGTWLSHTLRISPLYLCRLDSDSLTERWETTEICQTTFNVREIENETTASLS